MPGQLRDSFAFRVVQLRQAHQLSQEAFALRTGIHRTYVGGIERGKRNVTLATVEKIADAFGIEPISLLQP